MKPFLFSLLTALLLGSGSAQVVSHTVEKGDTAFSIARKYALSLERLLALNGLSNAGLRVGQVLIVAEGDAAQSVQTSSSAAETLVGQVIAVRTARMPQATGQSVAQGVPRIVAPAPERVPEKAAPAAAKAAPSSAPGTHTVQKGDTAFSIARRYGLGLEQLLTLNGLGSADLFVGQVLRVPVLEERSALPSSGTAGLREPGWNTVSLDLAAASGLLRLHRVQRGETLSVLAKRFGTSVSALQEANELASTDLSADTDLIVPNVAALEVAEVPLELPMGVTSGEAGTVWRSKALSLLGVPYVYGGKSPQGTDCSGFVIQVMAEVGLSLPRRSADQFTVGQRVAREDLQEGDLVFFDTTGRGVSHVGIYLGEGKFINANSYMERVAVDDLGSSYWAPRYLGARRVMGALASR